MPAYEAIDTARDAGLDLVEVAPNAKPPVCRIMDYGKYKYQKKKKESAARKAQTIIEVKEVKFRPKTDEHDYQFKIRHARRFLDAGNRVKFTIMFRGREMVHPEVALRLLERVEKDIADLGQVEQRPLREGRNMSMLVNSTVNKE